MKKIIIIITILLLLGIFMISKYVINDTSSKTIELTYKINAGIPFKWEVEIEDESIVKLDKTYILKDENKGSITGAPIYTNYVFKGLKKGTTNVTFKYVNFIEKKVDKEEKHTFKVDDNLNISLVVIPIK